MSHNTWLHRMVRVPMRPLARTRVTPNQVTMLRLATGLGAALICALGPGTWQYVGVGLFLLSALMDRADGELARLTDNISELGHRYDLIADTICNALIFIGIGVGLRHDWLGPWSIVLGLVAGLAISAIFLVVVQQERRQGPRAAELGSMAGFDPDDGILAVPLFVWFGFAQELIIAAAIGAPLFALYVFLRAWRKKTSERQGIYPTIHPRRPGGSTEQS